MKELILHIGTHKTGTSRIQELLRENKDELNGFEFVDFFDFEKDNRHDKICNYLDDPLKNRIVSYEAMSGGLFNGYSDVKGILSKYSYLEDRYKITIVVCYREHLSFLESAYSQYIHQGGSGDFDCFFSGLDLMNLHYQNHIETINHCFPKSEIHVLEYNRNIVVKFFELVGFDVNNNNNNNNSNVSFSIDGLFVASRYNHFLNESEKKKLRLLIQDCHPKISSENRTLISEDKINFLNVAFHNDKIFMSENFNIFFPAFNKSPYKSCQEHIDKSFHVLLLKLLTNKKDSKIFDLIISIETKILLWMENHGSIKRFIKKLYFIIKGDR